MQPYFIGLIALDIARERSIEAERRARLFRDAGPAQRTASRSLLVRLATSVTSAPAAVARRLTGPASPLA